MKQEQKDYTLEQIIEQSFDFSSYSEKEKEEKIAETSGLIMETALLRALDEAGTETQNAFNDFLEKDLSDDDFMEFITQHVPNFSDIMLDEIKLFYQSADSVDSAEE